MTNPAVFVATNAATTAAIAAAAARARREEEDMTKYSADDLEGWEFKIIRSGIGRFSNYQRVQQLCHEEAQAGWEMVEKFDNYRIRFKRRTENRSNDHLLKTDPYRTTLGGGEAGRALLVVGLVVAMAGVALAAFFALR